MRVRRAGATVAGRTRPATALGAALLALAVLAGCSGGTTATDVPEPGSTSAGATDEGSAVIPR